MSENATRKSPTRIRGGYRRRILDRLTEGGATVTEIASAVDLHMPHASAELKRLRERGWVATDRGEGERGARQALTREGWDALHADERARLANLRFDKVPRGALGCLLAFDGDYILLAFVRRPVEGPLALPDRPIGEDSSPARWHWAEPRERRPRWFSAQTLEPVPPPPDHLDPTRLDAWGDVMPVWGVQRYRLLGDASTFSLSVGSWFAAPAPLEELPMPENLPLEGDWVLGSFANACPPLAPERPVLLAGAGRIGVEAALRAAAPDAILLAPDEVSDLPAVDHPLDALVPWVELAHARMSPLDRGKRRGILEESLVNPADGAARRRLDEGTWRRFHRHWGRRGWARVTPRAGMRFDTTHLSLAALRALVEWIGAVAANTPLVVAWPGQIDVDDLAELLGRPQLRLLVLEEDADVAGVDRVRAHPVLSSPWMRYEGWGRRALPLRIDPAPVRDAQFMVADWSPPDSPAGIERSREALRVGQPALPLEPEDPAFEAFAHNALLQEAVHLHPEGDAHRANEMEAVSPLAAWLASTRENRWSRWQRIGHLLDSAWIELMDPADVPRPELPDLAIQSPADWRARALRQVRTAIIADVGAGIELRRLAEECSAEAAAWVASALLSEVARLPPEQQVDLATWGLDRFLDAPPPRCAAAIDGLDWLGRQLPEFLREPPNDWHALARPIAFALPLDHDLHLWALLEDWQLHEARPPNEAIGHMVDHLPPHWWSPSAESILTHLTESDDGGAVLGQADLAWPALILRPPGEDHRLPGGARTEHTGVRRTLLTRLTRFFERNGWPSETPDVGEAMLLDLALALRSARTLRPPSEGRTHPDVAWLGMPVTLWPSSFYQVNRSGDTRITARLALRASGHHHGLTTGGLDD